MHKICAFRCLAKASGPTPFNIRVRNGLFLKNYVTLTVEGAVSHNVLYF